MAGSSLCRKLRNKMHIAGISRCVGWDLLKSSTVKGRVAPLGVVMVRAERGGDRGLCGCSAPLRRAATRLLLAVLVAGGFFFLRTLPAGAQTPLSSTVARISLKPLTVTT